MIRIFQSTFPRGERRNLKQFTSDDLKISIHVPAWGTTSSMQCEPVRKRFQSTFPRGERRYTAYQRCYPRNFNPRSRVGNDNATVLRHMDMLHFNPRSRVGNDDAQFSCDQWGFKISIHVPAWGTTVPGSPSCQKYGYFNPRSRVGNDSSKQSAFI